MKVLTADNFKLTPYRADVLHMNKQSCQGFTLIELIVALAVAGILMGIGVPSFVEAAKNSKQSGHYQQIVGSLYLARSEAVKQTSMVTVCARSSDTSCKTGNNVDWNDGWLVFIDNPGTGLTDGQFDSVDTMLQIVQPVENDVEAWGFANGAANFVRQPFVRYDPRGAANWSGGTVKVCDDRGPTKAVALNIVLTGDIRKARGETPLDINSDPVTC